MSESDHDKAEASARAAVRNYLKLVEPDLRAGRLEMTERDIRESAATIIERIEPGQFTPELQSFLVRKLRAQLPISQSRRKGRRTPLRDVQIVCGIQIAIEAGGLKPTRNREGAGGARRESGCSIVAAELGRLAGLGRSEAAVEKIWHAHNFEAMPARFGELGTA